ncbi:Hypothetical protein NTJ_00351 [Nesidiocoris tenuis]|uniref:Uncharacterized protein n=1 Tax=Nesidiocoris tenuis TaxID=355587 RepID=A0ABN7A5R4_9HEMI|nr:Hypothetical protein NTJ_00351 [Nesidiocoris tenuis]
MRSSRLSYFTVRIRGRENGRTCRGDSSNSRSYRSGLEEEPTSQQEPAGEGKVELPRSGHSTKPVRVPPSAIVGELRTISAIALA